MDEQLRLFLKTHRISVVSILQKDGKIHPAAMHFAFDEERNLFYLMTDRSSRKCESLIDGKEMEASLVVGFNEEEMVTFQAEGKVVIASGEEKERAFEVYFKKYPHRASGKDNPHLAVLLFKPSWGRFRDYKGELPVESLIRTS
jgi:general stress protein 26